MLPRYLQDRLPRKKPAVLDRKANQELSERINFGIPRIDTTVERPTASTYGEQLYCGLTLRSSEAVK